MRSPAPYFRRRCRSSAVGAPILHLEDRVMLEQKYSWCHVPEIVLVVFPWGEKPAGPGASHYSNCPSALVGATSCARGSTNSQKVILLRPGMFSILRYFCPGDNTNLRFVLSDGANAYRMGGPGGSPVVLRTWR